MDLEHYPVERIKSLLKSNVVFSRRDDNTREDPEPLSSSFNFSRVWRIEDTKNGGRKHFWLHLTKANLMKQILIMSKKKNKGFFKYILVLTGANGPNGLR